MLRPEYEGDTAPHGELGAGLPVKLTRTYIVRNEPGLESLSAAASR